MKKIVFDDSVNKGYMKKIFNEGTERLCIHEDIHSELHVMIINKKKGDSSLIHMHPKKDEVCMILEGKAKIIFYNDNGDELDNIILKPYNDNDNFLHIITKGLWHSTVPITDIVYLECIRGPFDRDVNIKFLNE